MLGRPFVVALDIVPVKLVASPLRGSARLMGAVIDKTGVGAIFSGNGCSVRQPPVNVCRAAPEVWSVGSEPFIPRTARDKIHVDAAADFSRGNLLAVETVDTLSIVHLVGIFSEHDVRVAPNKGFSVTVVSSELQKVAEFDHRRS